MKTKEFDLEEALNGAKVVTRDGREVTQLTKFKTIEEHCLYGVVDEEIHSWHKNGVFYKHTKNNTDLFLAVEPIRIYANVYYSQNGLLEMGLCFKDRDTAELQGTRDSNYIKTIEITDEP